MGTAGGKKNAQKFNFRQNSFHKRKIALECKFQSNFVYSLIHDIDIVRYEKYIDYTKNLIGINVELYEDYDALAEIYAAP